MINILLFGPLIEIAGSNAVLFDDVSDTEELRSALHLKYPGLQNTSYILAVDKEIILGNTTLPPGCTVALLPAYSGG